MSEKQQEGKKKKESIVDLNKYIDKRVHVKFQGGREASGILKGYDQLLNLVLDNAVEHMRELDDSSKSTQEKETRNLGLIVARGTAVVVICPADGLEQIANPFIQAE